MDNTKQCKTCGEDKSPHDFYKHAGMKDGRLNECKDCFKEAALIRETEKMKDPEFAEDKKARARDAYHKKKAVLDEQEDREKHPWKFEKNFLSLNSRFPLEKGLSHHHWNLNPINQHDIFVLKVIDKIIVDKFLRIDMDTRTFITNDGQVLDTKVKHKDFLIEVLGKEVFS